MSELVIVESPAKSKTIEKYLGSNYHVVSSKGHIRDLATTGKYGLGIDIENGFQPNYVAIKGKGKDIQALKKLEERENCLQSFAKQQRKLIRFILQLTLTEKEKLFLGIYMMN